MSPKSQLTHEQTDGLCLCRQSAGGNVTHTERRATIPLPKLLCWLTLVTCLYGALTVANASIQERDGGASLVPRNLQLSHVTVREGLSQAAVNAIAQDEYGFIWFGTQEGLNRYDGYEMAVYEHDVKSPTSLSHNWVWDVLVDSSGTLWVGTDGGGLNRFDREQGSFSHFRHDPANMHSLSNDRVRVIYQDRQGNYWIGTDGGGLNRFDANAGQFIRHLHDDQDPSSLPSNTVLAVYQDRKGTLWVGTDAGLARLDPATNNFVSYRHDPAVAASLSSNQVRAIYEDRAGQLWIGTYEGGLNLFRPNTGSFKRFQHDARNPNSLSHNRVRDIYQDNEGTLWVATDQGLNEWRSEEQGFARYRHDPLDPNSLSDDRLITIFQDTGDVLWIGTFNGVNKWNYASDAFDYPSVASDGASESSGHIITAIDEAPSGGIWIGTYGGGISRLDLESGETDHYSIVSGDKGSLSNSRVMAIFVDEQESVWVGTRNDGLSRLDPASGKFIHYRHDPENEQSLSADAVTSIYGDESDNIWVGTYGGGLNRLDPETGEFTVFRHDPKDSSTVSSDRILTIMRDRFGAFWVGTEDGGINRFEAATQSFVRYQHDPGNPDSLGSNAAWEVVEDKDGSLWIATLGGGLNYWALADRLADRPVFQKYYKGDGLKSDTVFGILEDAAGFLWLSSNRGVSRLDTKTGKMRHFDRFNGLRGDEFNFGARLRTDAGKIVLGGTDGLVSFDPNQLRVNQHPPEIVLSAHSRYRHLATTHSTDKEEQELIELGYRDDLIFFNFAALDFASSDKNQYLYKLEGFDDSWIDAGKLRRATYTSLPAGTYTFRVIAANNDGVWNDKGASLRLEVDPPPWQTPWAYSFYSLFMGGTLVRVRQSHKNKLEQSAKQRAKLEREVQDRTRALEESNEQLKALNTELATASVTDSLTGLKNRRYLYQYMESEAAIVDRRIDEAGRASNASDTINIAPRIFFMMIDLDGFKLINDTHGHHAGDQALVQVRDVLRACCRTSDTVIRWGGDEFMVVGQNTDPRAAEALAERIRVRLADHRYQLGGGHVGRLSGSIGFAMYPFRPMKAGSPSWEQVTALADHAAYAAKQNGRNAWVGVYSTRKSVKTELNIGLCDLSVLADAGVVDIRTSIEGELKLLEKDQQVTV
jgi:diguanylate cyclase (GGDEF)-like protein